MGKIGLIIAREYLTRVKKKSFIILTILGPIFMAILTILPAILANETQRKMNVMVVDDNDFFINKFTDTENTTYTYRSGNIDQIKSEAFNNNYDVVLHILKGTQSLNSNLYYEEPPTLDFTSEVEDQINKLLFDQILIDSFRIQPEQFSVIKELTRVSIRSIQIDEHGSEKEKSAEISSILGMIFGFLIYIFILLYAGQVLRSVLEEKSNRIVEVLISTVKPMQLMMGKIIGVAMVGLTQFAIWVVFTFLIIAGFGLAAPELFTDPQTIEQVANIDSENINPAAIEQQLLESETIFTQIDQYFNVSFSTLIFCFLFYFIIGYLIYAALYAAVGSAADNETDSQQFTLPVTAPLLLTLIMLVPMVENPNGSLAIWMSMIPLTSPIAMLIRLPNGVPAEQLILSMVIAVLFFIFAAWLAARIYRVGILMYGKKITYRDILRWIKIK